MQEVYTDGMVRQADSHKGENGKVAVIGGSSHIHGAPIFSGLSAEASGVDLVFLTVPRHHETVAKMASLNFQVYAFHTDELAKDDVGFILQMLAIMDSAVIGPGIGRNQDSQNAMEQIITGSPCPLVIDATALQPNTLSLVAGRNAVVTPHLGELERMGIAQEEICQRAQASGTTILLKGHADLITGPDGQTHEVKGGNAGLTVGGTGDALAGLIAGLIAQKMNPTEAAILASTVIKAAGDRLFQEKGFTYTTKEVIEQIPYLLHERLSAA
jgi:NAD(P)H-hydrate epimerase